jgi:thioredoxin 1
LTLTATPKKLIPTFHETPKILGGKRGYMVTVPEFKKSLNPFTVKGFRRRCRRYKKFWHGSWLYSKRKKILMNKMISRKDFKKEVVDNMSLSIVQFTLEWSGACQIISPMYDELASSYKGQAKFFTVDVEKERGIDGEYGIMELPTILFFKRGKVIDHITGLAPKNVMISKIENALSGELN